MKSREINSSHFAFLILSAVIPKSLVIADKVRPLNCISLFKLHFVLPITSSTVHLFQTAFVVIYYEENKTAR